MQSYVETALATMRAKGLRITHQRTSVLRALQIAVTAITPYEIFLASEETADAKSGLDVVSVYRTLNTLTDMHLVTRVALKDGYMRIEPNQMSGVDAYVYERSEDRFEPVELGAVAIQAIRDDFASRGLKVKRIHIEVEIA